MKRDVLLITGANGFLARAVARQVPAGRPLAALVRSGTSAGPLFQAAHESVGGLVSALGPDRIDAVLHLAACIPSPSNAAPEELVPVNAGLVAELVRAYPRARHVLASSVSVYGVPGSLPLGIDSPPNRPNPYGLSKLAAEEAVRRAPSHAILRFSSLIGVGMKAGSFIPAAVAGARAGTVRLVGDGGRLQNYLAIDDAAWMCLEAALGEKSFAALGISERSHSNNEVAGLLAGMTGASVVREGEDRSPSYVYAFSDAMNPERPRAGLKEILAEMVGRP